MTSYEKRTNEITEEKPASHLMTGKYATIQEINDTENECWYYFIRWEGNEEALKKLDKDIRDIDWEAMEECSTFDIDIEHLVSAQTAKEMTTVELNPFQWHRKFDGKMDQIEFGFKKNDKPEDKMGRVFDHIGYGQIEDYVSDEDIEEEDLTDNESVEDSEEDSGEETSSEQEGDETENTEQKEPEKPKGIPPALLNSNLPRFARKKRHNRR